VDNLKPRSLPLFIFSHSFLSLSILLRLQLSETFSFLFRWSLACAIVITVAGDLDFLSSSETRVSVGWRGLEDGVRRSDKALAIRRIVFVATAIALPLKVGLFYAAAQR